MSLTPVECAFVIVGLVPTVSQNCMTLSLHALWLEFEGLED